MPQYNHTLPFKSPTTNLPAAASLDAQVMSQLFAQGLSTKLNITAANTIVKASAGRLVRILVLNGGTTAGNFVINDSATAAGVSTANQLYVIPFATTAGTVITLDCPVTNGIIVSAVPTSGSPQLTIIYT